MACDILPTLEFNAGPESRHDLLTRRILELAAEQIRSTRQEADYWRRRCTQEQSRTRGLKREADTLAILLQRLLDTEVGEDA